MMMKSKTACGAALIAALSLSASPASAADMAPAFGSSAVAASASWSPDAESTAYYGRYYDPYRYRHRRNRVDAGDVIAGVLILGGIAAVANAVKDSNRNERYRNRDYRDNRDRDYPYRNPDVTGIDRAASMCVSAIERDARVEAVDSVDRTAAGWTVSGRLFDGQGFTCSIGADGRIDAVDYGASARPYGTGYEATGYEARAYSGPDNQLDDDRYRAARADIEARGGYAVVSNADPVLQSPPPDGPVPSYPGGPLPGDPDYGD